MTDSVPSAGALVAPADGVDVTSVKTNVPAQLRARAEEARQKAAAEPAEPVRKVLLNDADLWERMAAYEEKNPAPR